MAFKMKGSSYKMGGVKTKQTMAYMKKSPLEAAKPDYPDIDGDGNTTESMKKAAADKKSPLEQKIEDKYLDSDLSTGVSKSGDRFEQRQGSTGSSTGEVRWIRDNFGRNLSRKQLMEAQREYFALVSRDSEGDPKSSNVNETPVVEPNKVQREDKGVDNQTEFSKAVNKGYFNKGKGSEYISTMPKPENFATFEEFEAAKRKHEMDNPNAKTMANYKPE